MPGCGANDCVEQMLPRNVVLAGGLLDAKGITLRFDSLTVGDPLAFVVVLTLDLALQVHHELPQFLVILPECSAVLVQGLILGEDSINVHRHIAPEPSGEGGNSIVVPLPPPLVLTPHLEQGQAS